MVWGRGVSGGRLGWVRGGRWGVCAVVGDELEVKALWGIRV